MGTMQTADLASPFRRGAVALACVVLLASMAACSGDDAGDSADEPSQDARETIATDVRNDVGEDVVDQSSAECFADRLIEDLGEQGALELNESSDDIADASDDEQAAAAAAFDECISGSVLAPSILESFYESIDAEQGPDQAVIDCVSDSLEGRTGTVLIEAANTEASGGTPQLTIEVLEQCVPDEVVTDVFVQAFQAEGATPEQAQCVANELVGQLGFADFVEISESPELPEQIQQLIGVATTACL